jgi:hypothetical protein
MHFHIISSIIGWFVTTLGIATKVALVTKAAVATKVAVATKAAVAVKAATARATVEVTGVSVTTGLVLANGMPLGPFPIQPMTPEQWKLIIESIKNTPHEIYDLYQSIPPEVFKWLWDIGSIGYGASGVYEGYKVTKDMSYNLNDPIPIPVG